VVINAADFMVTGCGKYKQITLVLSDILHSANTVYKSSAVAEMGHRLATIDVGRKVGADVPHFGEESWVPI